MKNKRNKLFAFGIVLCMLFAMAVMPAHAASSGTCGANLTWTLDDAGTLTISGTGSMTGWNSSDSIPWCNLRTYIKSVVVDDGVTSLNSLSFYDCKSLTSVTIGSGITSIVGRLFEGCSSLTSITIPNSVTSIGDLAFYDCTDLTSITIPDSVTSIGSYAFENTALYNNQPDGVVYIGKFACGYKGTMPENTSLVLKNDTKGIASNAFDSSNCSNLTSITIPDSVTSIGRFAFSFCSSLASITIPDSVTSIGDHVFYYTAYYNNESNWENGILYINNHLINAKDTVKRVTVKAGTKTIADDAFSWCKSLTSVTIPDSVTSIGTDRFYNCSRLEAINISENNSFYSSQDGVLFSKDKRTLIRCPCGKSGAYTVLDSVTDIRDFAFDSCSSLTTITIPDSVTSIGRYAFYGCSSLTSITIPDSVTSIGEWAFEGCSSLTSVTIGNSVTSIGYAAFSSCKSLKKVYYSGTSPQWMRISIDVYNGPLTNATRYYLYTITYTGEYTGTDKEYYLNTVTLPSLPELPYGYSKYQFTANGSAWDGVVKGDTTVVVTKVPINYTVTYTGDYTGTDNADYLTTVTFPTAPYGYTYTFKVDGNVWDGVVKGNTTVSVTKTPINYTVTYTGDYIGTDNADYLTTVTFPTAPYGYTYIFKVNDELWDGVVKGNTTVVVTKTINNYTITYTGDYEGTDNADYLTTATFPTAPYGYTYTFKVDGNVWDGVVKGDTTVVVTKVPCGDVNMDGIVTAKDNIFLGRYIAHWIGYDEKVINLPASDLDGSGAITAKDNVILARHLANWTGYDTLPYLK